MLRNAKSIGYSTAGSGLMVANIIKTLGLTEELKARTKFLDGFPAAEAVARGEVEIAMQQINVILPVEGAELAGPLPAELQQYNHFAVGRAGGLEGTRGGDRDGEVHGRAGERRRAAQGRARAAGALTNRSRTPMKALPRTIAGALLRPVGWGHVARRRDHDLHLDGLAVGRHRSGRRLREGERSQGRGRRRGSGRRCRRRSTATSPATSSRISPTRSTR